MNARSIVLPCAVLSLVLSALPGWAQDTTAPPPAVPPSGAPAGMAPGAGDTGGSGRPNPRAVRLKVGGFFPTTSRIRDGVAKSMFSYGISYDILHKADAPVAVVFYFDGASRCSNTFIGPTRYETAFGYSGLGLSLRAFGRQTAASANGFTVYAGAGAGVYFVHSKYPQNPGVAGSAELRYRQRTSVGGKVQLGLEYQRQFFAEADYTVISRTSFGDDHITPSGFNLSLGVRL